jgi:3-keto-disaccharide hydrolase
MSRHPFWFALGLLVIACFAIRAQAADDLPSPAAPPESENMKPLFNRKDLTGWDGDQRLWSIKDGVVRGETTKENPAKGNTFLIWRGGELKDFELRLTFRIDHGNSGIQYRSKQLANNGENHWIISGYQAEVENTPGKAGFLYHERGRGYLCNVGEKVVIENDKPMVVGRLGEKDKIGATYKKSDWNDYVIIAEGNHLRHYLNGVQTVDVVDNGPKGSARSGLLALQIHAGVPMVVEFKNVRLKQLDEAK